jgi:hypothetical protein
MKQLDLNDVTAYVEQNIHTFHERRAQSLAGLKLEKILKRKNPYLFKAKNLITPERLVTSLLDAHLSSQEETIFGSFLEGLAIYICGTVYAGRKSAVEGIDLEFVRDGQLYLVAIKSGPNWGNSSQIGRMKDNFRRARKIYRTDNQRTDVIFVNGCCYGRENQPDKIEYFKYCGQRFWEFISGDPDLYTKIVIPLGKRAKERNDEFNEAYASIIIKFAAEFTDKFCTDNVIDWAKLVRFNSAAK